MLCLAVQRLVLSPCRPPRLLPGLACSVTLQASWAAPWTQPVLSPCRPPGLLPDPACPVTLHASWAAPQTGLAKALKRKAPVCLQVGQRWDAAIHTPPQVQGCPSLAGLSSSQGWEPVCPRPYIHWVENSRNGSLTPLSAPSPCGPRSVSLTGLTTVS